MNVSIIRVLVELAELLDALPLGLGQPGHHKHHRRHVTHAEHPEGSGLAQRRLRREEELGDEEGAGPEGGDGDGGGQRLGPHGEHLAKEHAEDGGAPWPWFSCKRMLKLYNDLIEVFTHGEAEVEEVDGEQAGVGREGDGEEQEGEDEHGQGHRGVGDY